MTAFSSRAGDHEPPARRILTRSHDLATEGVPIMSPEPATNPPTTSIVRYVLSDPDRSMVAIGATRATVTLTRSAPFAMSFTALSEAREWLAGLADPRAPRLDVEAVPAWLLLGREGSVG